MRKTALYVLLVMGLGIIFPSCEKSVSESLPIMESLYAESKGLMSVSRDSVNRFSDKVEEYVTAYPQAKQHDKYKLIMENINEAILHITVEIHDEWDGDTTITF